MGKSSHRFARAAIRGDTEAPGFGGEAGIRSEADTSSPQQQRHLIAANVVPPTPKVQWGNTPRVHLRRSLRDLSVGPMDLASTSAWAVEIELLDTKNKQRGKTRWDHRGRTTMKSAAGQLSPLESVGWEK